MVVGMPAGATGTPNAGVEGTTSGAMQGLIAGAVPGTAGLVTGVTGTVSVLEVAGVLGTYGGGPWEWLTSSEGAGKTPSAMTLPVLWSSCLVNLTRVPTAGNLDLKPGHAVGMVKMLSPPSALIKPYRPLKSLVKIPVKVEFSLIRFQWLASSFGAPHFLHTRFLAN